MKSVFKVLILVLSAGALVYFFGQQNQDEFKETQVSSNQIEATAKKEQNLAKVRKSEVKVETHARQEPVITSANVNKDLRESTQRERKSLETFSSLISEFGKSRVQINDVITQMRQSGLEPIVSVNKNDATGDMHIIRSKNSLPGARYFHAQFFTDENGEKFAQHISFEYRPSKNAFQEAVNTAIKTFGLKSKPTYQKKGFASWETGDGYVVWVKEMGATDLKNDVFNAHSKNDIGTIRVAKELEIHGQDGHGDHEHIHQ